MFVGSLLRRNETRGENRKRDFLKPFLTVEKEKELICVGRLKEAIHEQIP